MKKAVLLFLFFISVSYSARTFASSLDSLIAIYNSIELKNKIESADDLSFYNALAKAYISRSFDSAAYFGHLARKEARKYGNIPEEIKANRSIAGSFYYRGMYDSTLSYLEQAKTLAEINGLEKFQGDILNNIGLIYYAQSKAVKAFTHLNKGLEIRLAQNAPHADISGSYNNLGLVLMSLGDYENSIEYFRKALSVARQHKDSMQVARILVNLGLGLHRMNLYNEAKIITLEGISIHEKFRGYNALSTAYVNLGSIYADLNQIDTAWIYVDKAIKLSTKLGAVRNIFNSYLAIANIELGASNYKEAQEAIDSAKAMASIYDSKSFTKGQLLRLEFMHALGMQDTNMAVEKAEQALEEYNNTLTIWGTSEMAKFLANYHKSKENYYEAMLYFETIERVNEQIQTDKSTKAINRLQLELEKQKQADNYQKEKERMALSFEGELANQRVVIILSVIIILLLITGLVFFYYSNQQSREALKSLRQKNEVILEQKIEIEQAHNEIKALSENLAVQVDEKTAQIMEYMHINSHKVRRPLTNILGLVRILEYNMTEKEREELFDSIKSSAEDLDRVIHELNDVLTNKKLN